MSIMAVFRRQFEILTHLRHHIVRRVVCTELAVLLLASFQWALAYRTVCGRKLGRSLGTRLVITTTHVYDWVQWLINYLNSKHNTMLTEL